MNDWNLPEYWKRVTCIMMISAGFDNRDIVAAAQCSLNTVKTVQEELEECEGDVESVASRKPHRKRWDVARSPEFVKELQKKVRKDPGKEFGL